MTSIVTDLLDSAGVLAKEDIPSKVQNCQRKMDAIKLEIQEVLKRRYVDFVPQYVKLDKLMGSLESATAEYDFLNCHIEKEVKPQMSASVTEYYETFDDLKNIASLKQATELLVDLYKHLDRLKQSLLKKQYVIAAQCVFDYEQKCKQINLDCLKDVEIVVALKVEFCVAKQSLIHQLLEYWKQHVSIVPFEGSKNYILQNQLTIITEPEKEFSDVILSLERLDQLENVLKSFGKSFLSSICEPIIADEVVLKSKNFGDKTVITVSTTKKQAQQPNVVLSRLSELFKTLNILPFNWSCKDEAANSESSLVVKFGQLLTDEFCKMLVERCLRPTVPKQSEELENFQQDIENAVKFHSLLQEIGFFSTLDNPLMEFIDNIESLCGRQMTLNLLSDARNLMKQDFYPTVLIGTNGLTPAQTEQTEKTGELNSMVHSKSGLSKATFAFPSCQISLSVQNLVQSVHQVIQEGKSLEVHSPAHSLKLYCAARSICELYSSVVPTYHKNEIANIPQQTAIFHNNCMYIAHSLLTVGVTNRASIPVTFVDLVPELRRLGGEAFLAQMRAQRDLVLQPLKDPDAFQNMNDNDTYLVMAEKAVRQSLQQLEFLKRVWSEILPIEVYFKAIGTLLNTMLEEIISYIINFEDIAAKTASHLDIVFSVILKQAPELLKAKSCNKSDDIHKYVKQWFKFQELQYVLGFNLTEIVNRWSSGKGILASHFKPDEVKHLIRALFQNTERRAAALGKIR